MASESSDSSPHNPNLNLTELPDDAGDIQFDSMDEDTFLDTIDQQLAEANFNATDYYAIFNLSKECSPEEIKEAYKRLSRSFHPDKHTDPVKRQIAQERFQGLSKAYEVLKDPNSRAIYDNYGEKALSMPWTVGPLLKTPQQLREEYERLAKKKREEEIENLIQTKTSIQCHCNATPIFASQLAGRSLAWRLSKANIPRLVMKHTYTSQISEQINLSLTSTILTQNGRGGGNLSAMVRHNISPKLTLEYGSTLVNNRVGTFKAFYQPTSDSFVNTHTTVASPWSPPSSSITIGRSLGNNVTGFISFNTGDFNLGVWGKGRRIQNRSSLSIGVASKTEETEYQTEIQVGEAQSHLMGHYKKKVSSRTNLIVSGSVSNASGLMFGVGTEHRVASKTNLGGGIDVGFPSGISLRFTIKRLGQNLSIPISISPEINLTTLVASIAIPTTAWLLVNEFAISPWRTRKLNNKLREIKELNSTFLENKRKEAEEALLLLQESVSRRTEIEIQNNGLVIVEAIYGKFEDEIPVKDECADVTIAVQNLVNDSQLYIVGGHSKSKIIGFYDPCFGSPKKLLVRYKFKKHLHTVIVEDKVPLVCPMRSHMES